MFRKALIFTALLLVSTSFVSAEPETLIRGGYNTSDMDNAIRTAKNRIETFLDALSKNSGSDFAVKVPINDGDETEHFWLIDISYDNNVFTGVVNNEPGVVKNVAMGQVIRIPVSGISDWLYFKDGKMHGNYTLRPLLNTMPPEQAAQFRALLAEE